MNPAHLWELLAEVPRTTGILRIGYLDANIYLAPGADFESARQKTCNRKRIKPAVVSLEPG